MAYFSQSKVVIQSAPNFVAKYVWGEKCLEFVRCSVCGCFSHWVCVEPKESDKMGINARLFTNVNIDQIQVRHFDGADTWKFLD